jgi:hypothetical protein
VLGQLRANLELGFPGAIRLFRSLAARSACRGCTGFPTAAKAAWLSPAQLAAWLRSAGYIGGVTAGVLHGWLAGAALAPAQLRCDGIEKSSTARLRIPCGAR